MIKLNKRYPLALFVGGPMDRSSVNVPEKIQSFEAFSVENWPLIDTDNKYGSYKGAEINEPIYKTFIYRRENFWYAPNLENSMIYSVFVLNDINPNEIMYEMQCVAIICSIMSGNMV